jgi:hypothetical protein
MKQRGRYLRLSTAQDSRKPVLHAAYNDRESAPLCLPAYSKQIGFLDALSRAPYRKEQTLSYCVRILRVSLTIILSLSFKLVSPRCNFHFPLIPLAQISSYSLLRSFCSLSYFISRSSLFLFPFFHLFYSSFHFHLTILNAYFQIFMLN